MRYVEVRRHTDHEGDRLTSHGARHRWRGRIQVDGFGPAPTYFEAAFNGDDSEYVGSWHYPDTTVDAAADELIVYKRVD